MEELEETAIDHDSRISSTESVVGGKPISFTLFQKIFDILRIDNFLICRYILGLEEEINQQETRLTAAEENILGIVCGKWNLSQSLCSPLTPKDIDSIFRT